MNLTELQKSQVESWASSGESISSIQNLIKLEFNIGMTYMDVRFLVDDLGVIYNDEDETESEDVLEDLSDANEAILEDKTSKSVTVDVDSVIRPGSLVSGTVCFTDGIKLGWQLTSAGQLGLIPGDDPEYRPSNEDLQEFQSQLQTLLKDKGF